MKFRISENNIKINKIDAFEEKLKVVDLVTTFEDYDGLFLNLFCVCS